MRTWPAFIVSGFTDTDLFLAALSDHDVAAIEELDDSAWRVFFSTAGARDRARIALLLDSPSLTVEPVEVQDEDWAARSQASLRAIRVGRLVVAPPWDLPDGDLPAIVGADLKDSASPIGADLNSPVGADLKVRPYKDENATITIVIQPSMGFGTGHHATTRLCLASLQALDLRYRRVLDIGTGSGVLAIAASLLGAHAVVAIDDDPDAARSALENVTLNAGAEVEVEVADLQSTAAAPADVVLANLTGGLLASAAARLLHLTAPDGCLVLSGFMEHEEHHVLRGFPGCEVLWRRQEDEWLCVTLRRPTAC